MTVEFERTITESKVATDPKTIFQEGSLFRRAIPLAVFWFLIQGALGLFLPYYGLYLREKAGLRGSEVGVVFAMLPLMGLFAQPLWGVIADRTGLRVRILVVLSACTAGGYLLVGQAQRFFPLLISTALLAVFSRAIVPIALSVSLAALQESRHAFGMVRACGTTGFLCLVVGFPWLFELYQTSQGLIRHQQPFSENGLDVIFPIAAILAASAAAAAFALPDRGALALRAMRGEVRQLLLQNSFFRVTLVAFGAYTFLYGPMDLFPIYVRAKGGDIDTIRSMWILMLLPEIPLVAFLGAGVSWLGPRGLLAVGISVGGLRWLLCGLVDSLMVIYLVQLLHAVVIAGIVLGAPLYVDSVVPPQLRSTGQALLGTISVGLGGTGSSLVSGWLLEHHGPIAPYLVGGAGAVILALLLPWLLPPVNSDICDMHGVRRPT